jgi:uncharacterized protein
MVKYGICPRKSSSRKGKIYPQKSTFVNMVTNLLRLSVSPSIGQVSSILQAPENARCIFTLAHGAGAGMEHPFMESLAQQLAQQGIATLRFNFPFTENKKGRPDIPAVAHKTIAAALAKAHELFPSLPLWASGKSFGGRMSSQHLSVEKNEYVKGLVFYGFPLHPPKKPSVERAEHLKDIALPMLFLQGTRDELAELTLIENVCSTLPTATLYKIEGADHAFKAGKQDVVSMLSRATQEWIRQMS